jgi:hypothetical protein
MVPLLLASSTTDEVKTGLLKTFLDLHEARVISTPPLLSTIFLEAMSDCFVTDTETCKASVRLLLALVNDISTNPSVMSKVKRVVGFNLGVVSNSSDDEIYRTVASLKRILYGK